MIPDSIAGLVPAAAALALERIAYIAVWRNPDEFRELCRRAGGGQPVDVLRRSFVAFKMIQAIVFVVWFARHGRWLTDSPDSWLSPDPRAIALGLAAIGVGQILNFAVFVRLGQVGVFYGARFGFHVPWVTGFPFSLLSHPQYVGTVLTIWGLFAVVRFPHADWAVLPLLESFYYVLGALLETDPATESEGSILSPRTRR